MANNNIPNSVDYTSRDFFSLRDDLIARVQTAVNASGKQWNAADPSDFGVALVESFAHVGDVTNYYIDRVANEAYLATATQRQSILNLAAMYGYIPSGYRQASVTLTFSNPTSSDMLVPNGSVFSVSIVNKTSTTQAIIQELFTLGEDVVVPAFADSSPGVATGLATHGRAASSLEANVADIGDPTDIAGESLGYSTGYGNQTYVLKYPQVVDGTVEVWVKVGNQYVQWSEVTNLAEYGPTDSVFQVSIDAKNYVTISFGDGVTGAVPISGDAIKADYVIGGGVEGNIDGGQTFHLIYTPVSSGVSLSSLSNISTATTSEDSAYGGEDPESSDAIRRNAPAALQSGSRAISLLDFKNIASSTSGVGKAAAYATTPTSVLVYVSSAISDTSNDYFPGYAADGVTLLPSWSSSIQSSVIGSFNNKTQIGCSVTVLPPTYVPVEIIVEYVKSPEYTDAQIMDSIRYGVVFGYGYNSLDFNQIIRPEKIEKTLGALPGIESVKIIKLGRIGDSGVNTLSAAQGEYFVFRDTDLTIYPVASLASLTLSGGYSIAFKPQTYTYALTVSGSTVTVTPTVSRTLSGSASTVTVNGTPVTSGSASGSISTPVGASKITVVVTSYDSVHTQTYTINVTR